MELPQSCRSTFGELEGPVRRMSPSLPHTCLLAGPLSLVPTHSSQGPPHNLTVRFWDFSSLSSDSVSKVPCSPLCWDCFNSPWPSSCGWLMINFYGSGAVPHKPCKLILSFPFHTSDLVTYLRVEPRLPGFMVGCVNIWLTAIPTLNVPYSQTLAPIFVLNRENS